MKNKIPKWNVQKSIVKDIRKRCKMFNLSIDHLNDKKAWKLYTMILDYGDFADLTLNKSIKKIKNALLTGGK
jgi:hypothetical protein